jgi:hypothetical protein
MKISNVLKSIHKIIYAIKPVVDQVLQKGLGLWYLMPLSTIFQVVSFIGGGNLTTLRKP